MLDVLIFILIALIVTGAGRGLLALVAPGQRLSFLERSTICYGLGVGSLALAVLAMGLCGILYRWAFIALLLLTTIFFRRSIAATARELGEWVASVLRIDFSAFERFMLLAMGFVCFFTLIGSLSPVLGMDSASYHMQDPKVFIRAHRIIAMPYTRESLWPFLVQMLFTLGLCLKGVVLAKLFHFAFYLSAIFAIYVLCRRYWPRPNSIMAASVFALIPAIFTGTTYAYTDLAVVSYTVMAFYGFFLWLDTRCNRWFYVAGIMCGFLLGIKITSAIVPVLILFLYLAHTLSAPISNRKKIVPAMIFAAALIAVCGVWYIRSWIVLGNPIYPFAAYLFGGSGYPEQHLRYQTTSGIGWGFRQFAVMLWPLSLYPDRFGGESIGAIFLIFLPMLAFVRKFSRFIRHILVIAFCLYVSWFVVYQYVRFFYPTLIFLSILVSFVFCDLCEKDPVIRRYSSFLIVLLFCYSAVLSVYHNADKIPVVFGFQSERDYLLKRERTYGMAEYVNQHLPPEAKVLMMNEVRLYYFDRDIVVSLFPEWDWGARDHQKVSQDFPGFLKAQGLGDYCVAMRDFSKGVSSEMPQTPQGLFGGYDAQMLKRTEFSYRDERYVYELWKIAEKVRA